MKKLNFTFLLTALLAVFSLGLKAQTTVVDIVVNSPDHTTLEAAVIAAELDDDLSGAGPFTVFAPTDAAFDALPEGALDALLADPTGDLAGILTYHVVAGEALSGSLTDGMYITTLNGDSLKVTIDHGDVYINDALVTNPDIDADNGVVHVIDKVLMPFPATVVEVVVNSEAHQTLEAAVIAADLAGALSAEGPFTVFAPVDDAFAALPEGALDALLADPSGDLTDILTYHVVSGKALSTDLSDGMFITTLNGDSLEVTIDGENVYIQEAMVTAADIMADNGVVHVIDKVMMPYPATVVEIVVNSEAHDTLEAAVIAADLAGALSAEGPFTVFAPVDNAFAALPEGALDALLANPTGDLTDILTYHVVSGKALSTDLSDGMFITTLNGDSLKVTIDDGNVYIQDAMVTVADIMADNGVVHVIDKVMMPYPATVVEIAVNSDIHTTLEAAVIAAELADDLSGEGPFTVFAPVDDAFAELPEGTLDALLADPTGDLAEILKFHVVPSKALSTDLSDGMLVRTLHGYSIEISIDEGDVYVNGAMVIAADLLADNGVVHVIDSVLLPEPATVVDIVVKSEDHATLETAVIAAELADDLSAEGPFTVFAPTDAAFGEIPSETLDALLAEPTGDLAGILTYHVVAGKALSTDLSDGDFVTTLNGDSLEVSIDGENVYINNAMVTAANLEAGNGVVHVINKVLMPYPATVVEIVVNSENHAILETAVIAAELADDLSGEGPFTVFAPTDAAFGEIPSETLDALLADPTGDLAGILTYHVVAGKALSTDLSDGDFVVTLNGDSLEVTIDGGNVYIQNAMVTAADIMADNGVVHVIDKVVMPLPATVVEIVVNSESHTTLESAVIAAELADDLSAEGPFTVFAPTDDAFAALPDGTLDDLLADPTGELANILLYHVASGKVMSGDLSDGQMVTTLFGDDVEVTIDGGNVYINDAMVTVADIEADNGVVHVIDAVLIPAEEPNAISSFDFESGISLFPNPASDFVTVGISNLDSEAMNVKILNAAGVVVDEYIINEGNTNINISDYNSGLYLMMFSTQDSTYTERLIVQ